MKWNAVRNGIQPQVEGKEAHRQGGDASNDEVKP